MRHVSHDRGKSWWIENQSKCSSAHAHLVGSKSLLTSLLRLVGSSVTVLCMKGYLLNIYRPFPKVSDLAVSGSEPQSHSRWPTIANWLSE